MAIFQSVDNSILRVLPEEVFDEISLHARRVSFVSQEILCDRGEVAEHVYFPESGVVSLIESQARSNIQIAVVGREGAIGCEFLLSESSLSFATYRSQLPGSAIRVPLLALRSLVQRLPVLADACTGAVLSLMRQVMLNAASNAGEPLLRRFTRSLIMMHDRVDGNDLVMTHADSASLLGVRRAGVTVAASQLEAAGLLQLNRGCITILDRLGLERELIRGSHAHVLLHNAARERSAG